jgi:hypothetical protein
MDESTLRAELRQFTGSETLYRHSPTRLHYTEGVRHLAERADCYWLLDVIASFQAKALRDPSLREFQLWELFVAGNRGTLICLRDSDDGALRMDIPFTDFPLSYLRLYLEGEVLMLPSEH